MTARRQEAAPQVALPGSSYPLGATVQDGGTNFAVAAGAADGMLVCLFDGDGDGDGGDGQEQGDGQERQVRLADYDAGIWHGFVPGVGVGQAYGYRAEGRYAPNEGLRFNPAKLLLDPYARAIEGQVRLGPELFGYTVGEPDTPSPLDSAGHVPRSLIVDEAYEWTATAPSHSYADTVVYEVHVKGFTMRHPGIPEELRGTYAGLAHEAAIAHLLDLGVTTVELLPVHQNVPEPFLAPRGLTNYWGYNTIGFFAPHRGYAAKAAKPGGQVAEFKAMVDALHRAGLEVVLDVVFNHTAEGGDGGPTLCYRGLDNGAYYRLDPQNPRYYFDTTGTGNSLNVGNPLTLQLIMDSLRYWLTEMRVDGFRFDLAATLARQEGEFERRSAFFDLVLQDPVVSRAKLIAEPWDVGQMDSYELGGFPPAWREWNGRYRDAMRDFWRGQGGIGEFASRFCGSSDIYGRSRRRPTASVNLITVHDGFTLSDLVSYNDKHNQANGEDNQDGSTDNRSWNCGAEGPTTDPDITALRARQSRAMLTTLLLSFGIPMLLGGDELGRTQQGNNNAYCQDNPISWFDWDAANAADAAGDALRNFTRDLIAFRAAHPVFRRQRYLAGAEAAELGWYTPAGTPMTGQDWSFPGALALALYLDGSDAPDRDADGSPLLDDDFLVLVNAWWQPIDFTIPACRDGLTWHAAIDSYDPNRPATEPARKAGQQRTVSPRSIAVLRAPLP
jgi:glycogen operon protein